jgi:subfamily B ATP-binding cassette protein MsbA
MDIPVQTYSSGRLVGRLLRYTRPYRLVLLVGVLAGMIFGGSVLPLLQIASRTTKQLSNPSLPAPVVTPAPSVAPAPGAPPAPATSVVHERGKTADWFGRAEAYAGRHGIPLRKPDGSMTWQCLTLSLIVLPLVLFLRMAMGYTNRYALRWLAGRVVRDLRNEIFLHLENQSLRFYGSIDVGRLISRCMYDTQTVEHVMGNIIAEGAVAPFEMAAAAVFVVGFAVEYDMLGLLLVASLVFTASVLPIQYLGRRVKVWTRRALERISDLVSRMHENFTGIRVVKAYHTEQAEYDRFRQMNHRQFKATLRAYRAELLFSPLSECILMLLGGAFVVIWFSRGLNLLQMVPIALGAAVFAKPLRQLAKFPPALERGGASLSRIFAILDVDTCLPECPNPKAKPSFDDRIVFEDVSFTYSADGTPVVDHACFEIRRGSVVAVVGATGSGKTTLANLLARFYDPVTGRITLDGIDLRDIAVADLRKLVGVVTQETILFNETIASNIAYGIPGATPEQITAAAEMANAHAFITAHPDGYERVVGEKGFVLSGGERQRVAIARAILRNPPILILDEATSALDTVTERQVQEAITRIMCNRTVFAIAHRLSTIRRADLILVVDKGRIVERGTHDELYAAGGAYRRLCEMQSSDQTA